MYPRASKYLREFLLHYLGYKQNSECQRGAEQNDGTNKWKADSGMTVREERHRNTNRAKQDHIIHADTDETRIIQCWNRNFACFKCKEQTEDELKAVKSIEHNNPHCEMGPLAFLTAENSLVIAIVRNL